MYHNIQQTDYPNDKTILEIPCPFCGKVSKVEISTKEWLDGLQAYKNGAVAQKAWPKLDADTRELFMSGVCSKCWDETFE